MNQQAPIAIIGGGITGLSIAWGLHRMGIEAVVYEKDSRPGGVIRTSGTGGWLVEHGPNTLMVNRQEVWELLADLQLDSEIKKAGASSKKRFVVKNGELIPIPLTLGQLLKTKLISPSAKLRLLREPFVAASTREEESVEQFITRRLGREPMEYAVDPFVSGIYAGDPGRLSVRHTFSRFWELEQNHGSLLKGALRRKKPAKKTERALMSFAGGMETLPQAMCRRLGERVMCNASVEKLAHHKQGGWKVRVRSADEAFERSHAVVISTVPAHSLSARIDPAQDAELWERLSKIPYAPLRVVALGYRREQVRHPLDGFGMLIPGVEGCRTLGTLFSSSLFPGRAPEGHVLLTSFSGGARQPEVVHQSAEQAQSVVERELRELLSIEGPPVYSRQVYWKQAIPQYELGYERYLDAMRRLEEMHPGLLLAGNFRGGVSVPDCIGNGLETARRAAAFLS